MNRKFQSLQFSLTYVWIGNPVFPASPVVADAVAALILFSGILLIVARRPRRQHVRYLEGGVLAGLGPRSSRGTGGSRRRRHRGQHGRDHRRGRAAPRSAVAAVLAPHHGAPHFGVAGGVVVVVVIGHGRGEEKVVEVEAALTGAVAAAAAAAVGFKLVLRGAAAAAAAAAETAVMDDGGLGGSGFGGGDHCEWRGRPAL